MRFYLLKREITWEGVLLKTALPATIIFAPAAAAVSIVSNPRPPSTSITRSGPLSLSAATFVEQKI